MNYSNELLKTAHKHCTDNRKAIAVSANCGCFYCLEIYPACDVQTYTSRVDAICPKCGIDSVLADGSGLEINHQFLQAMSVMWFETTDEDYDQS